MGRYQIRDWFEKMSGMEKPKALPLGEWDNWYADLKQKNPRQYFWAVTLPDFIDDITYPIERRYDTMRYWIRHRLFDRYHIVKTGLKPDYYDCSVRMLHANMNLMRDYVEVELAWRNVMFDATKMKQYRVPRFSRGWFRFKSFRRQASGLEYLDWESKLVYDEHMGIEPGDKLYGKPTDQALRARELQVIYDWWVNVYPNRPDPMEASGWNAYCDSIKGDVLAKSSKESRKAMRALTKIENAYIKEEEQMLIRLIKIRQGLWT